jgi:hypothetical protein
LVESDRDWQLFYYSLKKEKKKKKENKKSPEGYGCGPE